MGSLFYRHRMLLDQAVAVALMVGVSRVYLFRETPITSVSGRSRSSRCVAAT